MESDSFSTRSSSPASRLPASFPVDAEGIVRNALHELLEGDLADQKRGTLTKTQETAYNRFFRKCRAVISVSTFRKVDL